MRDVVTGNIKNKDSKGGYLENYQLFGWQPVKWFY